MGTDSLTAQVKSSLEHDFPYAFALRELVHDDHGFAMWEMQTHLTDFEEMMNFVISSHNTKYLIAKLEIINELYPKPPIVPADMHFPRFMYEYTYQYKSRLSHLVRIIIRY